MDWTYKIQNRAQKNWWKFKTFRISVQEDDKCCPRSSSFDCWFQRHKNHTSTVFFIIETIYAAFGFIIEWTMIAYLLFIQGLSGTVGWTHLSKFVQTMLGHTGTQPYAYVLPSPTIEMVLVVWFLSGILHFNAGPIYWTIMICAICLITISKINVHKMLVIYWSIMIKNSDIRVRVVQYRYWHCYH